MGDIARAIVAFQKSEGGLLSAEDLASYRSGIEAPVETLFGDIRLYGCGPWCQGPVLGQTLNILDPAALKAAGHNSADYLHALVEALKLAFADREAFYGDPRHVEVPLAGLLDADYGLARRAAPDLAAAPGRERWIPPAADSYEPRAPLASPGRVSRHLSTARPAAGPSNRFPPGASPLVAAMVTAGHRGCRRPEL